MNQSTDCRRTVAVILLIALTMHVAAPAQTTGPSSVSLPGAVRWGEAVNGIRVGLACDSPATTSDRQPRFRIVLENVSAGPIRVPSLGTYLEQKANGNAALQTAQELPLARPLRPVIDPVAGSAARYVVSGGDEMSQLVAETVVLDAGKAVTFDNLLLSSFSYWPGQKSFGSRTSRQTWWLMPASTYSVRFSFENAQAMVGEHQVWTGKALSDAVVVQVNPPKFDASVVRGEFKTGKTAYFVGEPVYVTFQVTNTGREPSRFANGSDSRGTGRHDRFSVRAWDPSGRQVPDPVKPTGAGGGLGSYPPIRPGETYSEAVLANLWCSFTEPGTYVLECSRSLVIQSTDTHLPEYVEPAVPVATRLSIVLRRDDAAFRAYLNNLPGRLEGKGNDPALGLPNGTSVNQARDELRALALVKNERAFDVISGVLRRPATDTHLREQAIKWVSEYGKDAAGPVLLELATAPPAGDQNARRAALGALVALQAEGTGPALLDALSSNDVWVRREAVMGCGRVRPAECFQRLMGMVGDPDPIVRRYLGAALAAYGDTQAVPVLLRLVEDPDPDRFIRIWAAGGLGKLGRNDGVPALIELLRDPETEDYRGNVVAGLETLTGQKLPAAYEPWKRWWDAQESR